MNKELNQPSSLGDVMPHFCLMGIEFNNIWKAPDFYVKEEDGMLFTAQDYIEEAASFDYDNAIEVKEWLQENYSDYTWYMVALNEAQL